MQTLKQAVEEHTIVGWLATLGATCAGSADGGATSDPTEDREVSGCEIAMPGADGESGTIEQLTINGWLTVLHATAQD